MPELGEATKDRPDAASLTLRQQLEIHRSDPQCSGCHTRMDVLGLGMENFDPIGRWRDREGKDGRKKIDPAGTLPSGESFAGPSDLKKILARRKEVFARNFTEKMFTYALGRRLERVDRREVRAVVAALGRADYRFSTLIEGVVTSYPFRFRQAARMETQR